MGEVVVDVRDVVELDLGAHLGGVDAQEHHVLPLVERVRDALDLAGETHVDETLVGEAAPQRGHRVVGAGAGVG